MAAHDQHLEGRMDGRHKVFISYSHEDTKWLQEIKRQLAVLEAEGVLMLSAKLGLLLVSSSLLLRLSDEKKSLAS